MSLDFTAIDFETASGRPGSACSVGLVQVRDGQVVHKSGGLIRHPAGLGEFAEWNTSVHGITAEMVATAPSCGTPAPPTTSPGPGSTSCAR